MFVYFITQSEIEENGYLQIKIGKTKQQIEKRISQLQTGNSSPLKLMGWICTKNYNQVESKLHKKYKTSNIQGEWFWLSSKSVLDELKSHGIESYLALQDNFYEIYSYDNNGIPEYASPWEWSDINVEDFCPKCGCSCGLTYNENYGGDRCLKCGIID